MTVHQGQVLKQQGQDKPIKQTFRIGKRQLFSKERKNIKYNHMKCKLLNVKQNKVSVTQIEQFFSEVLHEKFCCALNREEEQQIVR